MGHTTENRGNTAFSRLCATRTSVSILAAALVAFLPACARLSSRTNANATDKAVWEATLTPGQTVYRPGEAVTCEARVVNRSTARMSATALGPDSLAFYCFPRTSDSAVLSLNLRKATPVLSALEESGQAGGRPISLAPGEEMRRLFVFTQLSLERGEFSLQCAYAPASPDPAKPPARVYSKPAAFRVQGRDVAAHRYLSGLLTRADAIALAIDAAGTSAPVACDAILARDEMGYMKWWVNVTATEDGDEVVQSFFIDPYFARVWRKAVPFTKQDSEEAIPFSRDAQVMDDLRKKSLYSPDR